VTYIGPKRTELKLMVPHFRGQDRSSFTQDRLPIIAFDPGGTTGWSLLVLPRTIDGVDVFSHNPNKVLAHRILWEHGEVGTFGCEDEAVYQLSKMISAYPSAAIVVEDFILRAERREKSRELLSPVRLTAKLETYLWRMQRHMFLQSANQAIGNVTDDRLALFHCLADDGLPDHARDADRHAVLFMKRCLGPQGVSVKRAAWPHIYAAESLEDNTTGMRAVK